MAVEPTGAGPTPGSWRQRWLSSPLVPVAGLLALLLYTKTRFDALERAAGRTSRDVPGLSSLPPQLKSVQRPPTATSREYYVPVDARFHQSGGRGLELDVTLVLRNPNKADAIYFESVDYFDEQSDLLRSYVSSPFELGPRQKVQFFVKAPSAQGPLGSYFLVRWSAENPQAHPLIESVMVDPRGYAVLRHEGVLMRSAAPRARTMMKAGEVPPPSPVGYELKNQTSPGFRQKNP